MGSPGHQATRVVRHHGAALSPAPSPDGKSLFYLSLESDGLDLRRLELDEAAGDETVSHLAAATQPKAEQRAEIDASTNSMVPVVRPSEAPLPEPSTRLALGEDRPYGLGRLELLPLLGGALGPSASRSEVGLRLGDVLGRFEALAITAAGGDALRGQAVAVAWRGWPVVFELKGAASHVPALPGASNT